MVSVSHTADDIAFGVKDLRNGCLPGVHEKLED